MINPFDGDIRPSRIPIVWGTSGRTTLPFPHPWNYQRPLDILASCYWHAEALGGPGKHTSYLEFPGIAPILMSRDPQLIRAIATDTGDGDGQFDRDKLPAVGIAHGTGKDMLLYANGATWKRQRKIAAAPFGKTTLFQPEQFHEFEETFRQTPPLYFLPRQATVDKWVETADGRKLFVPKGTHVFLDLWHANRHEDHWGVAVTGYPAHEFVPERWEKLKEQGRGSKDFLHFGFGHGPRVCPGKHLGQLEVGLVVGAFLKLFRFRAVHPDNSATAAISTKPQDNALVELEPRRRP